MDTIVSIMDTIVSIVTSIGILAVTAIIAYYARVQSKYIAVQTKSEYNALKDWIIQKVIEMNVDSLEKSTENKNTKHDGWLTLNELYEYIPENLWGKNKKPHSRKSLLLRIIVDLSSEGVVQKFFADEERAKKYAKHGFGLGAIEFSYYDNSSVNNRIKEVSQSIEKLDRTISVLSRKLDTN